MLAITDSGTQEISPDEADPMRLSDLSGAVLTWETADGETRQVEFDK